MSSITSTELKKISDKGLSPVGSVQVAKNGARYVKVSDHKTGKVIGTRFLTGANKALGGSSSPKKSKKKNKIIRDVKSAGDISDKRDISSSKMKEFDSYFNKQNEIKKQKTLKLAYNKVNSELAGGGIKESIQSTFSSIKDKIISNFTEDDSIKGGADDIEKPAAGPDAEPAVEPSNEAAAGPPVEPAAAAPAAESAAESAAEPSAESPAPEPAAEPSAEPPAPEPAAEPAAEEKVNVPNDGETSDVKPVDSSGADSQSEQSGDASNISDTLADEIINKLIEQKRTSTVYCDLLYIANRMKEKVGSLKQDGGKKNINKVNEFKEIQGHMNLINKRIGEMIKNGGGDTKSFVSSLNSSERKAFRDLSQSLSGGSSKRPVSSKGGSSSNVKSSGFAELDSNFKERKNGGSNTSSKTSSLNLSSSINSSYKLNKSRSGGGGSCSINSGLKSLSIESSKMEGGRSNNSKENLQKAVGLLRNYYKDNLA